MMKRFTLLLAVLVASAGLLRAQMIEDFEGTAVDGGAWGGYEASVVDNPETTGNPSSKVWKVKKKWGHWDGSWVNFSTTQDYTAGKGLEMKILSTMAGTSVMAKVEHGTNGAQEVAAATTVAGAWETLYFDFSEVGADYDNVVFFINGGTEMNLPDSILVDDIKLVDLASSPKATIATLQYDGVDVPGAHQAVFSYKVELPAGTTEVPAVTATAAHSGASVAITDATALPGTATVVVTAEDASTTITYTIEFVIGQEPTAAAPAPPARSAAEYISIYSDAYTNIEGTDLNPYWWQSTAVSYENIGGDEFMKYSTFNYQGVQFGSQIDATDMEFLHVDMWTANASTVNVFCISVAGGEKSVNLPVTAGQWVSYDIPMSDFTSQDLPINDLHQFKFDGGDGSVTIYVDNLYFYRTIAAGSDATLSDLQVDGATIEAFNANNFSYLYGVVEGTTAVPTVTYTLSDAAATVVQTDATGIPGTTTIQVTSADQSVTETYSVEFKVTRPAAGAPTPPEREAARVISVFSDAYTSLEGTNWNPDWGQSTKVSTWEIALGDTVLEYKDLNWQGTLMADGAPIDASDMDFLHVDMWTNNADSISLSPLSGAGEARIGMLITPGQWVSYDIPVASFPAPINVADITGFKFDAEMGEIMPADIILDNIYFYSTVKSEDATLSDLQVDGTTVTGFDAATLSYTVELPQGTTDVPTVTATPTDDKSTVDISDAGSLPGTTFITVTAEDPAFTLTYAVEFTLAVNVDEQDMLELRAYVRDGLLNLVFADAQVNASLEVFSITGQQLLRKELSSSHEQIELASKGVLVLRITDHNTKAVRTMKVVAH